jgi:hypothetical protein
MPGPNGYKNESLKMEDIELSIPYAITINAANVKGEIKSDYNIYKKLYEKCFEIPGVKSKLLFEYSPIGRLHAHGTITFHQIERIAEFYQNLFTLTKVATFKLDIINDKETWVNYCNKQRHIMKPFMNSQGLPSSLSSNITDLDV